MNSLIERFEKHITKTDNCWLWKGAKKGQNYGSFSINGKDYRAHRIAYKLYINDYDQSLNVLHSCDHTLCVNPDHLFLGTHQENMNDKVNKNRQAKMPGELCPTHKLTEKEVIEIIKNFENKYRGMFSNLSKQYNVSSSTIECIYHKRTWTYLERNKIMKDR